MTVLQARPRTTDSRPVVDRRALSRARLDRWRSTIERSILDVAGGGEDELLNRGVRAAIDAFFDHRAEVRHRSETLTRLLDQIADQQARRGFDAADLAASFRAAHIAAQRSLAAAMGPQLTHDGLLQLRQELVTYLAQLHLRTHTSLVRARELQSMSAEERKDRLGLLALGRDTAAELERLAAMEGIDLTARVVAIVSVATPIPPALRDHPAVTTGASPLEALVPAEWDDERLTGLLQGQAVVSPAVPLRRAVEAVELARQAADLLRTTRVVDERRVVPCADLLGTLLVGGRRLLAELITDKHLGGLDRLAPTRRVALGELALELLETGQPIDHVARRLGIPRQTAHSRTKTIRAMFGDAFHDPTQRLELIVALHAALPRWRDELHE